jgi:hypothetical protein
MGIEPTSRAVLIGHLIVTIPAIVVFLLVVLLNLRIFGPPLLPLLRIGGGDFGLAVVFDSRATLEGMGS